MTQPKADSEQTSVVGRQRELRLVTAALTAGRDLLLEGPPGTSKTTLLRMITASFGVPLVFVEGNADLTTTRLVGHHDPAEALQRGFSAETFVEGPLVRAMRSGGFLYIEEVNRAPEDTLNALLTDGCCDGRTRFPPGHVDEPVRQHRHVPHLVERL
jgi:MoxR-like ATPase